MTAWKTCVNPLQAYSALLVQIETLVRLEGDPYVIVEYTNKKQERIDTGSITVTQILDQINSVAEEMTVTEMLSKAGLLGQKLDSKWGVQNDTGIISKTPHQ